MFIKTVLFLDNEWTHYKALIRNAALVGCEYPRGPRALAASALRGAAFGYRYRADCAERVIEEFLS